MRISISKITPDSEQTSTAKMATVKKPVPVTPAKAELKAAKRGEMTDTGTSARDPVAQEQKQVVDKAFTTADLAAQNSAIAQRDIAQQGLNILQNPSQIYDPAVTGGLTEQYAAAGQAGLAARITQQQYQQAATEYRDALNQQLYGGLRSNRDYASMSQGDKETAVKGYSGLNGKDLKLYSQMYYRGNDPTLSENPLHRDPTAFATDEQAADFFYLWNKKGPDAARAYYNDYLLPSLNQQKTSAAEGYARDIADKAPVAASGLSVATNLAGSAGIVDIALQNMTRRFGGDKSKPIDYNTAAQLPSRVTNEIRQEVSKNIEKSVDSPFWKAALPFLYETGMSIADNGVMILLNKLGVPEGATLASMSGIAGTAEIRNAKERGATDGQALAFGLSAAIAEGLFEKLSLDRILHAPKPDSLLTAIREVLTQGFIESSEEVATTLAKTAADDIIMRDKSEIETQKRKLMEDGVSEAEAEKAAAKQWVTSIFKDALGGLISGVGMGGGNQLALGLTHTVSDVKDTVNILSQNREDIRQAQAEQQESEAPAAAPEAPQQKNAPVITAATRNTDPLRYATDKVQSGNELTGGDIRAVQDNAEAMQTLRDAGVLDEKIAPGAEGREQIRNAVQDYAAQASNINEEETIGNEDQNRERAAEERQNTEGSEERDTGMVPRLRFSDTYRDVRDTKRQIRSAVESRVAASAAGLNQKSAAEIGLKNGTDSRSITELTDDVLTSKQRDAVKRYAKEGVNLHFINGFMEQRADNGSLSRARGWINDDGTEIWVQADHPRLSWEYILEHEDLHKEIKRSPALRKQILDDIQNDPNVAPYFDELADRYAKAYADTNLSPEDIYEELLCDYRAGFDALYDYDRKRGKQLQKAINLSIKRNAGARQTSETSTQRPTLPSGTTAQTKTGQGEESNPALENRSQYDTLKKRNDVLFGSRGQTWTEDNLPISFTYAVVPLDSLVISNDEYGGVNKNYPAELQPRDRSRVSGQAQVQRMANSLVPQKLADSPTAQNGAPIVRGDGIVIGGNGRSAAIAAAYKNGKASQYEAFIRNNAQQYGIDVQNLPNNPVLVRIADNVENWQDLARQLNVSSTAVYSASEKAQTDAAKIGDIIDLLVPTDSGSINNTENRDFIQAFVNRVVPKNERGDILTASGLLSQNGLERALNAIFYYAYGDAALLSQLSEDIDPDMKNVINALAQSASAVAALQSAIESEQAYDIPVRETLIDALSIYRNARQNRQTVREYLDQGDMLRSKNDDAAQIARFIEQNKGSAKQMRILFSALAQEVMDYGDPAQGSMFGGETYDIQRAIRGAARRYSELTGREFYNAPNAGSRTKTASGVDEGRTNADASGNGQVTEALNSGNGKGARRNEISRFSREITPQQDTDYLAAVERGDMETARRMVDEAAKRAGYTRRAFHQTGAKNITVYDLSIGTNGGTDSETPYGVFTKRTNADIGLGDVQMSLYVRPGKTLRFKNREELHRYFGGEYKAILDEIDAINKRYGELYDTASDEAEELQDKWLDAHPEIDTFAMHVEEFLKGDFYTGKEVRAAMDKADSIMSRWTNSVNELSVKAKEVLTEMLKAEGYDSLEILVDSGSGGRETDTFISLDNRAVKSADPVTYDDDGNVIPLSERFNPVQEDIRYSRETDPTMLAELDRAERDGDVIHLYRTMQILDIDGQKVMMSPMNARRGKGKDVKWDPPFAILNDDGSIKEVYWTKADESPELRDKSGKFPLKKGVGFSDMPVAYNPYMHGTSSMLNDQFSTAYKRPNLVTVEVIVPKSEESHGYHAEGAKDPVGWTEWKSGIVSTAKAKAGGEARDLFLSRWMKPIRIIPDSEVADHIINTELKGTDIKIPANVVTPSMLEEIRKIAPDRIADPNSRYADDYNAHRQNGSRNSIELDPGVIDAYYNSLPISKKEQPERKISKTRTNTYELSGFFDKVINDLKDADEGMYAYDVVHEKQTTDAARERLLADFDGAVEDLINKEYWTAEDVDTAMGILHVYKQRGNLAGDYTDFLEFSQIVHPMVRQDARALQAMAKYSRTAAEEARKAAQSVKEAAGQLTPAEEKKVKQATDDVKKAAKASAKEAAEETVKAAAGELKDSRMTRDALNLIREIYDNLNVNNKEGNYPVKAWTTLTGDELARRIASRFSDRRKQRTTMQLMLSDLLRFAQEHALPERQKVSGRTATDIISDYLNNRNAYAQAWGEAQAYLRAVYSENEDRLNALDSFLNATISQNADPQHVDRMMFDAILESADTLGITEKQIKDITATGVTEGTVRRIADELVRQVKGNLSQDFDGSFETQLRDAVRRYINGVALSMSADQRGLRLQRMENRASRALGIKMTELLTQSKQTKAAAANSIAQYLISELDVPATDAAIIADAIAQDYIDRLAQKADARLQKMFEQRPEATRMKKSQRQKLLELIRLGGLTNQNVEDAVVDALGLGKISRVKQREIMTNMAQFADTYDAMEAGDLEGLRNLIRRQAAYRKTKLSRMTEQFLNNEGDEEYLRSFAMSQLASIAEDYRPRGVGQKISTWQTIAHLFNPKTGLRNVGSNEGFDVIATAANNVSMIPDMIMGLFTGKRHTIGFETGWLSKAKRQGAKEGGRRSALEVSLDVSFDESGGTGKYGNKTRRTFSMAGSNALGRIMSHLEKALGYELNVTDEIHKGGIRRETLESLARYVEKGYMTQELANEIAEKEALYRSFQDDTAVGTILRTLKEGFNVIGIGDNGKTGKSKAMRHTWGLGDLITKYTQVPGALIHRAIEFSPLGYAKALYNIGQLANEARKGNDVTLAQRKAALAIGQATTGTGLILLFRALAKMGLLLRGSDKDKDKNAMALKAGQGLSGTQLNLDGLGRAISGGSSKLESGDTLIDLGFLEPLDSLMTIAALMSDNKDFDVKSDGIDTLEGIYKALENTSAMQTFSDVMNTIRYHDPENDLPLGIQIPVEVASSGVSGFVPGPVRHVAQAMDTDYRDQYRSQNVLAQMLARTMNSIPGVREKLAPKITPLGQEKQYQAGPVARVLNAVANPATISVYNSTRVTDELDKLYDATGDANIWPERNAPYTVTIGDKITLTPDERTEYQTVRGGTVRAGMEQLLRMSWYTKLSPDTRAEVVNWLENFANYVAKVDFADGRRMNYTSSMYDSYLKEMEDGKTIGQVVESKYSDLAAAIDADIPEQSYTGYKTFASTATADKNADGKTISGSKRDKVLDYIDNIPGLTIEQKDFLYYDAGYAASEINKAPWHNGSSSGLQLPSASTNDQKSITGLRLPGK